MGHKMDNTDLDMIPQHKCADDKFMVVLREAVVLFASDMPKLA